MLALYDAQVRLVLLNHVAVCLSDGQLERIRAAGIKVDQLTRLRQLSAVDLSRLAAMRGLRIGVAFDGAALQVGLRAVALVNEARALEAYFIRHGASTRLMKTLFKYRRKLTHTRRREFGAWRPAGRPAMPDRATRASIYRTWLSIAEPTPRIRYYRLHREFPDIPIAVLEAVIRRPGVIR